MKKIIILLVAGIFIVSACKKEKEEMTLDQVLASGDLIKMRERFDKEQKEKAELEKDIALLEAKINELDTTVKKHPLVTAIRLQDSIFKHFVEVQGSVKTKDDAMVFPEYAGVMTNLYVREGQYVRRGALVAKVDDGGLTQQIAQQEVQLALARTTYEKQKSLWDQNIGSEMQYLQAKSNVAALEKAIAAMRVQLKKVNVYAPFGGIVEEIITKQGQVVSPGATPLFRLVNLGSMYVEAEVPESYLPKIKRGTEVEVTFEALDKTYSSRIRRVNNTINPDNRSFIVEVNVPNRDKLIKPNLIAELRINDYTNKEAILIPGNIISEDAVGGQYVFVLDTIMTDRSATAKKTLLETGETTENDYVEILEGLAPGQMVIDEGARTLEDGDQVEVLKY